MYTVICRGQILIRKLRKEKKDCLSFSNCHVDSKCFFLSLSSQSFNSLNVSVTTTDGSLQLWVLLMSRVLMLSVPLPILQLNYKCCVHKINTELH